MKNDTFASTKFLLAALGLAFVKAGQVLVEESSKLDAMDDQFGEVPAGATPTTTAPQITVTDINNAPRDKNDLPWDERIHSGNKTINADGTWKKRKGVSDAVVDAVTAELRAITGSTAPVTSVAEIAQLTNQVVAPPVPTPAVVAAPPVPVPVAAPAPTPYTELCDFLAKNTGDGHALNNDWIAQFFAANSTTLPALATDLAKSALLLETLRTTLAGVGVAEVK